MLTEEQIAKLPKYAQAEVRELQDGLAKAETLIAALTTTRTHIIGEPVIRVKANPYDETPMVFPWHTTFEFDLARDPLNVGNRAIGTALRVGLRRRNHDGAPWTLGINGDEMLMVMPQATNDVQVITQGMVEING